MKEAIDRRKLVGVVVLLAIACALPFIIANYRVFQLTLVLAYSIALLGLNMLTGFNGQISLGHGAFYAIGAYTAAILMDKAGWPYWATIPIAPPTTNEVTEQNSTTAESHVWSMPIGLVRSGA